MSEGSIIWRLAMTFGASFSAFGVSYTLMTIQELSNKEIENKAKYFFMRVNYLTGYKLHCIIDLIKKTTQRNVH